MKQFARSSLQK